jgi:hypothetical protein
MSKKLEEFYLSIKQVLFFAGILPLFFLTVPYAIAQEIQTPAVALSSNVIATRLHNIDLMRHALKPKAYEGYDIIMISSTTEEEAEYQQEVLEKIFTGTSKKDGREPIILSVVDLTEGGQLIGGVYTWMRAEEKMRAKYPDLMMGYSSLIDYIQANNCKVAAYHNGGRGERFSPLTQSLGNSRGVQKLVGSVVNAEGEEVELDVLLGVILQCSSFAATNRGTHIDIFWTSQIAFGSHPHDQLIRSNFGLDKFLVGFNKNGLIAQNIADFGTAALTKKGRLTAFYGNKRFASRKGSQYVVDKAKIEKELLSKGDRFAYDFGSFSVSIEMWQLILDYWKRKNIFESVLTGHTYTNVKRDIDPHFIQPFIRFLYGMNDIAHREKIDQQLPSPSSLATQNDLYIARENFDVILQKTAPEAHLYIWEDANNEIDAKKKAEAVACMHEVMEFYLLYRQTPTFANLEKVFGFIDLGDETQWFRYRRPIDIMNEKFEMLTDVIGKKIEAQLNGSVQEFEADELLLQRSFEARMMRGITDDKIAKFIVNGKRVMMTLEDVKEGKMVEGVYIKNSIVQNCHLEKGSRLINSIANQVVGKVIATHSYLESSTCPLIEANASLVHQVVEMKPIKADAEVVSDVYKSTLDPAYHGRMRAPIGYDPKGMPIYKILGKTEKGTPIYSKEFDETIRYFLERIPYDLQDAKEYGDKTARTDDGRFTFEEIREIEPHRVRDKIFRDSLESLARKVIVDHDHLAIDR